MSKKVKQIKGISFFLNENGSLIMVVPSKKKFIKFIHYDFDDVETVQQMIDGLEEIKLIKLGILPRMETLEESKEKLNRVLLHPKQEIDEKKEHMTNIKGIMRQDIKE